MFELRFGDFTLLVDGLIGVAALVVVAMIVAGAAWVYVCYLLQ
jgi:hypothetical protein